MDAVLDAHGDGLQYQVGRVDGIGESLKVVEQPWPGGHRRVRSS
jgi:hypothetical protein